MFFLIPPVQIICINLSFNKNRQKLISVLLDFSLVLSKASFINNKINFIAKFMPSKPLLLLNGNVNISSGVTDINTSTSS